MFDVCYLTILGCYCKKDKTEDAVSLTMSLWSMQQLGRQWQPELDSMRWFSHQRSPSSQGGHAIVSSDAACCVRPRRTPYYALSMGMTQQFFVFCPWWPWPLTLTFEFERDFCTAHLTAKFHHPMFNRSEGIVRTNKQTIKQTDKQTDAAENIHLASLCYAGG